MTRQRGRGGMLSVSEEYIKQQNAEANLELFGQEYNPESYAICCSDLLIKDEPIDSLIYGDTLGVKDAKSKSNNFLPHDGHPARRFHYMFGILLMYQQCHKLTINILIHYFFPYRQWMSRSRSPIF
jgi:N-6 DNA Methylase